MTGEHKSPEKLALNPFGAMPIMKDGDIILAESNAILRYLAKCYNPTSYGLDIKEQSNTDWALDWAATTFLSKHYANIWYPVAGFGAAPANQEDANKACVESLEVFAKKFLAGKFIGGNTLNIADYKIGSAVWYLEHPAIEKNSKYKNPQRISQYAKDFYAALSPESQKFLEGPKGFLDTKLK
eukprot:CAMPEP_0183483718 /NCGR_PEP_ID=MMETSP0370-20130417/178551_1 /TAXON_ID=268820 /ORGANISM="Peridinium aciculiferum, Strain PAER-2" /LENGTH=182 /DNA_ID=CAMNT_0025676993 /DNA_START=17 /DNA_END=565 /DNA_ORIENTATION=+